MINLLKDLHSRPEFIIIVAQGERPSRNMGQKVSSLRKEIRNAKKDARRESNFDKSRPRVPPSKDECAILSTKVVGGKEDAPRHSSVDESPSPVTSTKEECAVPSVKVIRGNEDAPRLINADGSPSRVTSSEKECAVLFARAIGGQECAPQHSSADGSLSRVTSSEKEYSVLLSNGDLGVQSSITRTSSNDSSRIQELQIDPNPGALLTLPTELVLEIADHLPPSSIVSLSYSCRTICTRMGAVSIEQVLGDEFLMGRWKVSAPSVEMRNIRLLERLEWRRMLDRDRESLFPSQGTHEYDRSLLSKRSLAELSEERHCLDSSGRLSICTHRTCLGWRRILYRDNKSPSPELYCSLCFRKHDRSLFSTQSHTAPSVHRRCLGSAGRLWICPFRKLSLEDLIGSGRTSNSEGCRGDFMHSDRSSHSFCGGDGQNMTYSYWPILKANPNRPLLVLEVVQALRPLNVPICPHMRLNNALVASHYSQEYQRNRAGLRERDVIPGYWFWKSTSESKSTKTCDFCGAEIKFGMRSQGILAVLVIRVIDTRLDTYTDRDWIRHVADPVDFQEYTEAWDTAADTCSQRTGSGPIVSNLFCRSIT